ncbi:MAG TPA: hypothetical protein VKX46_00260 [Ktedonobacteraceae bacterium]|jgi:hypothetical protein|nr:hypothetical protein [Ktedonobacteraceae bacterium]
MDRSKRSTYRYKKLLVILVAAFLLSNFVLIFPVFASSTQQQTQATGDSTSICIPIPFIHPCPSPTPRPCVPIPIIHPCPSPTPDPTEASTPTPGPGQTNTPGPDQTQTGTPGPGNSATPTPTPRLPALAADGPFTLTATQIVGTNAHLDLSDLGHPVFSFSAVTIQGMKLSSASMSLSASGAVNGTGVLIKTSIGDETATALISFANKADLLILIAGGTVPTLVMTNVTLHVDRYIQMQTITLNGLSVG